MSSLSSTHFELFGLPTSFIIDDDKLASAYRTVQAHTHPDRFAADSEAQKRVALQWATRANDAYRTLKDPLRRAIYVLQLRGIETQAENNTVMASAFLMLQLEWRESIEAAKLEKNLPALEVLLDTLQAARTTRFAKLASLFKTQMDQAAADVVRELMFIERVVHEAQAQIEKLEYM
ncbi:Fe-S protein assembly co-chaperone HscB [Mycoavidus sp. SF9855]|uniref:Fe-S protein assembly co-chaperone HscB n=1 Tax=Mycoavidus sp. SF9855 TaxID=2968475 RepID=UPI00211C69C3|nr:Fe-S protein assembly co-chaperone HscB [Mycoavidus sp. SF9855]UUM20977.1 Fe-S protein assembly co-chaperone HscB [Mycoavidus sp. SF9855]